MVLKSQRCRASLDRIASKAIACLVSTILFLVTGLVLAPGFATAQTIDLTLSLTYADDTNPNSGGTWEVFANTSATDGIALLSFALANVDSGAANSGPLGNVNGSSSANAGFSNFNAVDFEEGILIATSQVDADPTGSGESGIFYGVGSVANGSPRFPGQPAGPSYTGPIYSSLNNLSGVPWGTSTDFVGAASIATGTFAPSTDGSPEFADDGSVETSFGVVYTSVGTATTVGNFTEVSGSSITRTVLSNLVTIPGDYNADGTVDAADYTVWRDTLGSTTDLRADGNDDMTINQQDYAVWKGNFGMSVSGSGSGAGAAVPEPTGAVLALTLMSCFLATSGRSNRRVMGD